MNEKTPWNDVSRIWKKIAGVIAAVGILATFVVQVFKTPADWTYVCFAALGFVFLMISWYVDRQALYSHEELEKHEKESKAIIDNINNNISELVTVSSETRKDTLRIQLLMLMQSDEDNVDTILKVAETYFVKLKGDWYMTNEFNKWAKKHDVSIPPHIYNQMESHLGE